MNKKQYEGNIDGYSFLMKDDGVIEVWSDMDSEYPESYIYVKSGTIKSEKDFHFEISDWWMKKA